MPIGIVLRDSSLCFRAFVKGTIRYNRIVPFHFWRHSNCKGCLFSFSALRIRTPRECWRICKKPFCMCLTTVRRCKRPSVFAFVGKCNCKFTEPDVISFGFSDPLGARVIHMHRAIPTLLRVLELTRSLSKTNRGRGGELLLIRTQGFWAPLLDQDWKCGCPVGCIQHLYSF